MTGLLRLDVVAELNIPDSLVCRSDIVRELLLAEAWAAGTKTIVDGAVVTRSQTCSPKLEALRGAAGVATKFHRALRIQDAATVEVAVKDQALNAITSALEASGSAPAISDRALADMLNRRAIPTRRGLGTLEPQRGPPAARKPGRRSSHQLT